MAEVTYCDRCTVAISDDKLPTWIGRTYFDLCAPCRREAVAFCRQHVAPHIGEVDYADDSSLLHDLLNELRRALKRFVA